tara:strand:- start:60 stop:542 length:483 start_codon:yes stop_codon:yes gene_type:complete
MSKQPEAPTQGRLHELFDYKDGQLLNKTKRRSQIKVGAPAGHMTLRGYVNIRVDGKMYKAHRLIYVYHHGVMPAMLDHIDCDRTNNRIENLRPCTKAENGMNRAGSYSKTGLRNVYRRGNMYQVHVKKGGVHHYVGTFDCVVAAANAASATRAKLFGEFA